MNMDNPCGMKMYFHARACERILFDGWQAYTLGSFILSCFAIGIMAFTYEALKFIRDYLYAKEAAGRRTALRPKDGSSSECCELPVPPQQQSYYQQMFNWPHAIQTALHALQLIISYLLMLVIMLCNYWLWLAIIIGAGAGYFCFGWIKRNGSDNECCY